MAFHFVNNGRPTPGIPVLGRREPPISALLTLQLEDVPGLPQRGRPGGLPPRGRPRPSTTGTSQAFHQGEVHVAFPFVEGPGRPEVCNVKSAEIGGSRLPTTGMPGVGLPFCQKWKATNVSPILNSYHRLDGFAG